jgi:hypothetical protein
MLDEPETGQDSVGWLLFLAQGSGSVSLRYCLICGKNAWFLAFLQGLFPVIVYVITRD